MLLRRGLFNLYQAHNASPLNSLTARSLSANSLNNFFDSNIFKKLYHARPEIDPEMRGLKAMVVAKTRKLDAMIKGFKRYPTSSFNFHRLASVYMDRGDTFFELGDLLRKDDPLASNECFQQALEDFQSILEFADSHFTKDINLATAKMEAVQAAVAVNGFFKGHKDYLVGIAGADTEFRHHVAREKAHETIIKLSLQDSPAFVKRLRTLADAGEMSHESVQEIAEFVEQLRPSETVEVEKQDPKKTAGFRS